MSMLSILIVETSERQICRLTLNMLTHGTKELTKGSPHPGRSEIPPPHVRV